MQTELKLINKRWLDKNRLFNEHVTYSIFVSLFYQITLLVLVKKVING